MGRPKAFLRTLQPLRVIADPALEGPFSRAALLTEVAAVRERAAAGRTIGDQSAGLWRLEKLGFGYCRHGRGQLNDIELPHAALPILHVGLGIASTETAGFSVDHIAEQIEPRSHPDYRLFAYESMGCIWAVYASPAYRSLFRWVSKAKIPARTLPAWSDLMTRVAPEIGRVLAHGYGRTLYFKHASVRRAVQKARQVESLDLGAAAQGIAFACAMLNHADLARVLELDTDPQGSDVAAGLHRGLIYALAFWQWAYEGFLERLAPQSDRQRLLIEEAGALVAASRKEGKLAAFGFV